MKTTKTIGSSFDDFLAEEGIAKEVETGAVKKLISFQLLETIQKENLTKQNSHNALKLQGMPLIDFSIQIMNR